MPEKIPSFMTSKSMKSHLRRARDGVARQQTIHSHTLRVLLHLANEEVTRGDYNQDVKALVKAMRLLDVKGFYDERE